MTEVTYTPAAARLQKASWLRVGLGVLVGYVAATLALLPLLLAADFAGVWSWRATGALGTDRSFQWPWPGGASALLAHVAVLALVLTVAAVTTSWAVRAQTGRPAAPAAVALCLAVTGYLPGVGYGGLLGLRDGVAFLVVVALVRWKAADAAWRLGPRALPALAALLVAAAAVAAAYGATHPLYRAATIAEDGSAPRAGIMILLGNVSRGDVEVLAAAPARRTFFAVTVRGESAERSGDTPLPLTLPARGERVLRLAPVYPAGGAGYATVDAIQVRFRQLGRIRTQRVPLEPPARLACP